MDPENVKARQKLLPVEAPWRIVASAPFLWLTATESNPSQPTQLSTNAYFLLVDSGAFSSDDTMRILNPPRSDDKSELSGNGPYQRIKITFESGGWVRMSPAMSDGDVFGEENYDWSLISFMQQNPGEGIADLRRNFVSLWREKSLCPDPRMYEVLNSDWLRSVGPMASGFRHFLISGHDAFVEILARGWKWESAQDLKW